MVRRFIESEVLPHHDQWEIDGSVSRDVWQRAGALGLLGLDCPEEFGGGGRSDFIFHVILSEELIVAGATGVGFSLHNDVVAPYLNTLGTTEQQRRWLPGFCSGTTISALAMTEPDTGSDLQSVRLRAEPDDDGYVLTGTKTFITNGALADLVIVLARTGTGPGARGLSLIVVEGSPPGLTRSNPFDKIGMKAQDTVELAFDGVRVPRHNLLGREGRAFLHVADQLPRERLSIACYALANAEHILAETVSYCRTRTSFDQPLIDHQHIRLELARLRTELDITRVFVDSLVGELSASSVGPVAAAQAKYWATDLEHRCIDQCLQFHGGSGFMASTPVARAYTDSRIHRIYGGSNEIMREIIGQAL